MSSWDSGQKLKQEIMANTKSKFRDQLSEALDKLIKRKVEDFELGYVEGRDMTTTTHNTVNIINSNISNSVVQINQSGKDAISKETANKLEQLVNSEEIKGLPDNDRFDVLDQANAVINELNAPATDDGKVRSRTEEARQVPLGGSDPIGLQACCRISGGLCEGPRTSLGFLDR